VTLTAIFAGIAAPRVALIIGRVDRKLINLTLCALVVASNIAVALTADYPVLLAARTLLGIAIGGFFALAGATVVRLVTMEDMGKGMSIVFMGLSAAWQAIFSGSGIAVRPVLNRSSSVSHACPVSTPTPRRWTAFQAKCMPRRQAC
jgi:MFS family permease